ncbi:hypothetical protein OIU77_003760 [Salix suchowensis]|uniref:Pentatricopeptide repeat-containing protein n=1 Tax=Salix suchowensis TaxID=1278906 RepID=A0ABQ9ATJ3_9ROSI|nr:hypothetical protein OIU77_003760 [Salix suchowensis]
MIANNILPDAHTFPGVFTAAALNLGCIFDARQAHVLGIKTASIYEVFVGSSLVNFYCKVGCVFEARKLFDRMPDRDLVSWTTMISGYASKQMAREALGVFGLMRCIVLWLNIGVLGFVSVLNALVTMYAKCGSLNVSLMLFEMCSEKNAITWSALITGYSQAGDSHKALKLFCNMHYAGFVPSEFTLVGALNACSDVAGIEEGKQTHGYLLKSGYETQIYIATALADMYAKCGFTGDARKGFDFLLEPDLVLWTSIIAAYAGEKLLELGTRESSAYALLSSIHSAMGRLADVVRVRRMMKVQGVRKETGCSWIELKSHVHVFVVGDQIHPQIGEIQGAIWRLRKHMKDEGYRPGHDSASMSISDLRLVRSCSAGRAGMQFSFREDGRRGHVVQLLHARIVLLLENSDLLNPWKVVLPAVC